MVAAAVVANARAVPGGECGGTQCATGAGAEEREGE